MKTFRKIMLATALVINALTAPVQAQSGQKDAPQYYAVYESAYHETSKLKLYPDQALDIKNVEVTNETMAVTFAQAESGSAIINIYNTKGILLLNQYVELNGTSIELPVYTSLPGGVLFLHVFTEKKEAIIQFTNDSKNTTKL